MAETSIDLSAEELCVLADEVGLRPPATVSESGPSVIARRALVARRMLVADDWGRAEPIGVAGAEATQVHEAVQHLAHLVCAPALSIEISQTSGPLTQTCHIFAAPEAAVEHAQISEGIYRHTAFLPADIIARIAMRTQLTERPDAGAQGMSMPMGLLRRLVTLVESGDIETARQLVSGGENDELAHSFVDALAARQAWVAVTVTRHGEGSAVEGGRVSWMDAGERGLWRIPSPQSVHDANSDAVAEVSPAARQDIWDALAALFPSSEGAGT